MSSLYLHIPFCAAKCPYCDFFSQVARPGELDNYCRLLEKNLHILKRLNPDHPPLRTVYFGGGTPSLLSAIQVDDLLKTMETCFGLHQDAEISLEVNPGQIDRQRLRDYRRAGINRLSLGIQSFNDLSLALLGRIHSAQTARQSITDARAARFDNLSFDLIFALPGQDEKALERDIAELLSRAPEHISLYGLTYEEGTPFATRRRRKELIPCDEEMYRRHYELIHQHLNAAGYQHYEISNFTRPGFQCRHNQAYWRRGPCLAVGAGAHGFSASGWGLRWQLPADLQRYRTRIDTERDPSIVLEEHDRDSAMREFIYLGLRTASGVDLDEFRDQFAADPDEVFADAVCRLSRRLQSVDQRWRLAWHDWLLYDHLVSFFF